MRCCWCGSWSTYRAAVLKLVPRLWMRGIIGCLPLLDDGKASTEGMSVGGCEHSQIVLNKFLDDRGQYAWSCLRNLREIVGDAPKLRNGCGIGGKQSEVGLGVEGG